MNKMILSREYEKIWQKILNKENFVLMRMGDGEKMLMQGKKIHAQEDWLAPEVITPLGIALSKTLDVVDKNVIYAISCPCCNIEAYYWYMSRIKSRNITFANIFVNNNYKKFIIDFSNLTYDAVVIANSVGRGKKIGNLNVIDYFSVSNQCVDFYNTEYKNSIEIIKKKYATSKGIFFVVSAGPLSQLYITELYKNNPNNMYIDFGSSIDCFIHGKDTRPYNNPNNIYAKRNCWMYDVNEMCMDVSIVLTLYKKPDALEKQLNAIMNQSLKPKEIILFQDKIEDANYSIELNKKILDKFDKVFVADKNYGVWKRFEIAKQCTSKFVCIFDDDTIPGERWLENCHSEFLKEEGIYVTIGIVLENPKLYAKKGYYRVGWDNPYNKKVRVDFGGHSWFIDRKYIDYMFENTEKYQVLKYAAEDMAISFKCKEKGINTYVPKHPIKVKEMWGSIKEFALKYGQSSEAISTNSIGLNKFNRAMKMFIDDDHKFIINENVLYVKINKLLILMYNIYCYFVTVYDKIISRIKLK